MTSISHDVIIKVHPLLMLDLLEELFFCFLLNGMTLFYFQTLKNPTNYKKVLFFPFKDCTNLQPLYSYRKGL